MRLYSIFHLSLILAIVHLHCTLGLPLASRDTNPNAILAAALTEGDKIIRIRDNSEPAGAQEVPSGPLPAGAVDNSSDAIDVRFHGHHMYSDFPIAGTTTTTTTTSATCISAAAAPTSSQPPSYWYTEPISIIDIYLRCINKQQADALVALMQATPGITPQQIADTIGRIAVYQVGDTWVQPGWCTFKSSLAE